MLHAPSSDTARSHDLLQWPMTAVMATWHCEMHGLLSTPAEKGKSFVAGIS